MKEQETQAGELAIHIARQKPGWGTEACYRTARQLVRLAWRYSQIQVKECNEPLTEADRKEEEHLTIEIRKLAMGELGIDVQLDGDPRGHTVKLFFSYDEERVPSNTWGGPQSGWGIG